MPPASTTPASASTGSISGVRASASAPWRAGRVEHLDQRRRRRRPRPRRASAASRTTVRIVPSTGLHHRLVGRRRTPRPAPRPAPAPSSPPASATTVGQAPQDLRQDHARVAAGAHERAVADRPCTPPARSASAPSSSAHDRLEREGHVRAGVAVGHRVHVEPVDAVLVGPQGVPEAGHHRAAARRRPGASRVVIGAGSYGVATGRAGGPAWRLGAGRRYPLRVPRPVTTAGPDVSEVHVHGSCRVRCAASTRRSA